MDFSVHVRPPTKGWPKPWRAKMRTRKAQASLVGWGDTLDECLHDLDGRKEPWAQWNPSPFDPPRGGWWGELRPSDTIRAELGLTPFPDERPPRPESLKPPGHEEKVRRGIERFLGSRNLP